MTKWVMKYMLKHLKILNQRLVNIMKMKGRDQNFEQVKEIMLEFGFNFNYTSEDCFDKETE